MPNKSLFLLKVESMSSGDQKKANVRNLRVWEKKMGADNGSGSSGFDLSSAKRRTGRATPAEQEGDRYGRQPGCNRQETDKAGVSPL